MRLNHLDLHVAATCDFLGLHFGFQYIETRGRDGLAILLDSAGLEVVISHPYQNSVARMQAASAPPPITSASFYRTSGQGRRGPAVRMPAGCRSRTVECTAGDLCWLDVLL